MTSLFLDVDGRQLARHSDIAAELDHLLRTALEESSRFGDEGRTAVAADAARIEEWFTQGVNRHGVRGFGLFSASSTGWFQVVPTATPVVADASLGEHPHVGQLAAALRDWPPILVALADGERSRMFRLAVGEAMEREGPLDEHPRRVDTDTELGSFQRRDEEATRRHLRAVAAAIVSELDDWPAAQLVLAGPSAIELADYLPREVRRHLVATVALAVSASVEEVLDSVAGAVQALAHSRKSALVEEVSAGRGGGAVGLLEVLVAIEENNVRTLLVRRGLHLQGVRCSRCNLLQEAAPRCVRCASPTRQVGDLVEEAIAQALVQHAEVEFVDALGASGSIGAIERHARPS